MFKTLVLLLFVLSFQGINAQIKLTHNIGEDLIDSGMSSCEEDESWGRVFDLSDFGVTTNEQFIIRSGQVGIIKSDNGAYVGFNVFSIDSNFPDSEPILLGSGGYRLLSHIDTPQIIEFDLDQPIVVPAGVERILVEIGKSVDSYNPNSAEVIIAGTEEDTGDSWYRGCRKYYTPTLTTDIDVPVPDANFFITATGETFSKSNSGSDTTLSHSLCDNLTRPMTTGCSWGGMSWSRDYVLKDFGISADEEYTINSGQVGIFYAGWGTTIQFRIYKIDDNFPGSFSDTDFIGSSQVVPIDYFGTNTSPAKIFHVEFDQPITVPKGTERILVEVYQANATAFPAATEQDTNVSWYRSYAGGCTPFGEFKDIKDLGWPETKLYITVTGKSRHATIPFGMNITNNCSDLLKEFSLTNTAEVSSVTWNFGDPASGANNTSTDLSPFHDFSEDGTYTITATVTANDGNIATITETINVKQPPRAYGINNIEACENTSGTGISTGFDTSGIESQVLENQTDKVVTYIDGSGNRYDMLPNPFTNTVKDRETIRVRVARKDELCCYAETTFDLIVNPLPDLSGIEDIVVCDDDNDGLATFNLTPIQTDVMTSTTSIEFYFQDGQQIPNSQLDEITNRIKDQETITVRAKNTVTQCYNERDFKLVVSPFPVANTLNDLTGCDDNNDGISEYFNTSNVESHVLGNQTGMEVSYYNESGNELSSPLPNPFTNTKADQEIITVRVTNPQTGCFSETFLNLVTSSKPSINQPATLYACDTGNGIASFNTSTIENQLIGSQTGLIISYYDENGNQLSDFSSSNFRNSVPYEEQITARIEDPNSTSCAAEISFSLKTVSPPAIELDDSYEICSLGESLELQANPIYSSWTWFGPEGNIISEESSVKITSEGVYGLSVLEEKNGILCENYKEFELVHSEAPVIENILFSNFSEDSNIQILVSGDGDFEYSIDGANFQASNIFTNKAGGTYDVTVRDINGCGELSQTINLLNYPRFFTPNSDGYNDSWHITGLTNDDSLILIFDRYGKLLKQLFTLSDGWDGTFNGHDMPSDDYWFRLDLQDGTNYSGHFSLVR